MLHPQTTPGERERGSTHAAAVARAGGKDGGGRVPRHRRRRGHRFVARLRLAPGPGAEVRGDRRRDASFGRGRRDADAWVPRANYAMRGVGCRPPGSTNCSALGNHKTASAHTGRGATSPEGQGGPAGCAAETAATLQAGRSSPAMEKLLCCFCLPSCPLLARFPSFRMWPLAQATEVELKIYDITKKYNTMISKCLL